MLRLSHYVSKATQLRGSVMSSLVVHMLVEEERIRGRDNESIDKSNPKQNRVFDEAIDSDTANCCESEGGTPYPPHFKSGEPAINKTFAKCNINIFSHINESNTNRKYPNDESNGHHTSEC